MTSTLGEVAALTDLYRDSSIFPDQGEESIQGAIRNYLGTIAAIDWSQMEARVHFKEGKRLFDRIRKAYYAYTPTDSKEEIWYTAGIDRLNRFNEARAARIFDTESSMGALRWILLTFGGLVLILMPCFFRVEYFMFKLILTLFLANIIAFMLFITYSLDHPFSGYRRINPYPFQYALEVIKSW